ncbi:MAG: enoyl-CoA hydratase/isomerase family protein [Deltaproteobacteria bacterium]|nr:MAG: enoyl-CoA hydratase/isomerase family protein [Deltaproteobacteria bacterium]
MNTYENILLEEKRGVAVLTLNKPENRNPLTEETKTEMIAALEAVHASEQMRALVITGQGTAFCAGGDVKKIGKELTPEEIKEVMHKSQQLLRRLINLGKPIIAAVNGDAFGMGCNLALAADFAIASERAKFCQVFVKLGLTPDFGALYLMPRLIGLWKSRELAFLGNVVEAEEAAKIGLVYKVVPHGELEKEAMDLADRLARMPTLAIGIAKQVLNRSYDMTLDEVLEKEIETQIYLTRTHDHREGVRALMEKRKPKFQGK